MTSDAHRTYHRHLLGRIADVLGLNLDLDLDLARISLADLERALLPCSQCPDPAGCEIWLEEPTAGADGSPHLCMNRKMLERLRKGY